MYTRRLCFVFAIHCCGAVLLVVTHLASFPDVRCACGEGGGWIASEAYLACCVSWVVTCLLVLMLLFQLLIYIAVLHSSSHGLVSTGCGSDQFVVALTRLLLLPQCLWLLPSWPCVNRARSIVVALILLLLLPSLLVC